MNENNAYGNDLEVLNETNVGAMETENLSNELSNEVTENETVGNNTRNKISESGELKIPSYKKIMTNMTKVQKKSIPIMTKYEKARIMGERKQQLANGAKPCVNTKGLRSIDEIVEKELEERAIPFIIRRILPNGICEDWRLEEFEYV